MINHDEKFMAFHGFDVNAVDNTIHILHRHHGWIDSLSTQRNVGHTHDFFFLGKSHIMIMIIK
jgi:hypothetical protein